MTGISDFTIALVGAGNMGGAMLGGWLAQGVSPGRITVIDPAPADAMREKLEEQGVRCLGAAPEGFHPDVIVLAVKPQIMGKVLPGVRPMAGPGTLCISVAAGVTIAQLAEGLGANMAIIRAMPNTPALVSRGITVNCPNPHVTGRQRDQADMLMRATGKSEWVGDEALIDAVTAVSGSGPAYVFHLAECMAKAGEAAGLPGDLAMTLARQTVAGAGELLARSEETPARLRENVTSPNGTTAAALSVLMGDEAMAKLIANAVTAAKKRSIELSQE
jgi:pyrroline-5-carboxylate reductase